MRIIKRLISYLSYSCSHWKRVSLPSACTQIVKTEIPLPEAGAVYKSLYPEVRD